MASFGHSLWQLLVFLKVFFFSMVWIIHLCKCLKVFITATSSLELSVLSTPFQRKGRALAEAVFSWVICKEQVSGQTVVPLVFRDVAGFCCQAVWLQHKLSLMSCLQTFSSKLLSFFFFFHLTALSILHHHNSSFLFQPSLIDEGTCFSPGHLDDIPRIEILVTRSLFNSVFTVYLQMLIDTVASHTALFSCCQNSSPWTIHTQSCKLCIGDNALRSYRYNT